MLWLILAVGKHHRHLGDRDGAGLGAAVPVSFPQITVEASHEFEAMPRFPYGALDLSLVTLAFCPLQ